ncbi:ribitol 5-phosphate transferase FKRP-like [Tubulanus polymorphus]|uniref:ribitol 5-phosphate transferase FKRP-like n=1 Tax=Tubulanus polymorphus TaxID=672921 RepID=UPI003DA39045
MKITPLRIFLAAILLINVGVLYYLYHLQLQIDKNEAINNQQRALSDRNSDSVTFIIREFEEFDNEVLSIISNIAATFPRDDILVVADKLPYPPIDLHLFKNVKVVVLKPDSPGLPLFETRPENFIHKSNVVLVPDGVRIDTRENLKKLVRIMRDKFVDSFGNIRIAAAGITPGFLTPAGTKFDLQRWTLQHSLCHRSVCDSVLSDAVLAMRREDFLALSNPFLRPIKHALFIQTSLNRWKVYIADGIEFERKPRQLYAADSHVKWKHETREAERLRRVYEEFGVKKVIDVGGDEKMFGCGKTTARCFGTVINDMPEYIYANRWTPPCCLKGLRETAAYVIRALEESGVRYWLEGGSLLGAARNEDIIPWDYDVDIGIYLEDIPKCKNLKSVQDDGGIVDENDYVWQRSDVKEGHFFRVQYSETNHLHVDIFPFYSKNGIMTKKYWFKSHRQDREFPEKFLQPMTKIKFAGIEASAPNNVREFLEYKFGAGVIENPKYPNSKQVDTYH